MFCPSRAAALHESYLVSSPDTPEAGKHGHGKEQRESGGENMMRNLQRWGNSDMYVCECVRMRANACECVCECVYIVSLFGIHRRAEKSTRALSR